ncbi:hypothetical protein [Streptomyces sp. NPDC005865]|uniref:hypothetical protein n=1 Tax=Streptomyces sp. NPDC005865 TaxID=3155453 RepID=UPI0033E828A0
MNRPTLPVATALAAAAALFLTACGGDSEPDGTATGAGQEETGASARAQADSTAPTETADFGLPQDIKVEIESDTAGDKAKDRILKKQAENLMARQRIFVDLDPKSPFLTMYFTGKAKSFYTQQLQQARKRGKTISGTYRYYDRKVTQHTSDLAYVSYCEDQTKAFPKDIKTKKVESTTPTPNDYTRYDTILRKAPGGVWQLQELSGRPDAKECQ